MMKLCCHSISYKREFGGGRLTLDGLVLEARRLGFDGLDLHESSFAAEDHAYLMRIKHRCLKHGLSIACLSINNDYGKPPPGLEGEIDKTCRWIDNAAIMGAPQVRVFAGAAPEGDDPQAAWARCADALRETAEYGEEQGVMVSLQNHNHGQLIGTADDAFRMLGTVGHGNMGFVLDTGQFAGSPGAGGSAQADDSDEFDYLNSIQRTALIATHVRCKLYDLSGGQETTLEYDDIFEDLRDAKYNGWLSLVYEGAGAERQAVEQGVRFLRPFQRDFSS